MPVLGMCDQSQRKRETVGDRWWGDNTQAYPPPVRPLGPPVRIPTTASRGVPLQRIAATPQPVILKQSSYYHIKPQISQHRYGTNIFGQLNSILERYNTLPLKINFRCSVTEYLPNWHMNAC